MNQFVYRILFITFLLGCGGILSAEPGAAGDAPWDTVMAELQIIESMNQPDSVKTILTRELFSQYQLSADDYGQFYERFLRRPPEKQLEFFRRVENIILERIKQEQQQQMSRE